MSRTNRSLAPHLKDLLFLTDSVPDFSVDNPERICIIKLDSMGQIIHDIVRSQFVYVTSTNVFVQVSVLTDSPFNIKKQDQIREYCLMSQFTLADLDVCASDIGTLIDTHGHNKCAQSNLQDFVLRYDSTDELIDELFKLDPRSTSPPTSYMCFLVTGSERFFHSICKLEEENQEKERLCRSAPLFHCG